MKLMTNNPAKYVGLKGYGLAVAGRVPLVPPITRDNRRYLEKKRAKMGHIYVLDHYGNVNGNAQANNGPSNNSPSDGVSEEWPDPFSLSTSSDATCKYAVCMQVMKDTSIFWHFFSGTHKKFVFWYTWKVRWLVALDMQLNCSLVELRSGFVVATYWLELVRNITIHCMPSPHIYLISVTIIGCLAWNYIKPCSSNVLALFPSILLFVP